MTEKFAAYMNICILHLWLKQLVVRFQECPSYSQSEDQLKELAETKSWREKRLTKGNSCTKNKQLDVNFLHGEPFLNNPLLCSELGRLPDRSSSARERDKCRKFIVLRSRFLLEESVSYDASQMFTLSFLGQKQAELQHVIKSCAFHDTVHDILQITHRCVSGVQSRDSIYSPHAGILLESRQRKSVVFREFFEPFYTSWYKVLCDDFWSKNDNNL